MSIKTTLPYYSNVFVIVEFQACQISEMYEHWTALK